MQELQVFDTLVKCEAFIRMFLSLAKLDPPMGTTIECHYGQGWYPFSAMCSATSCGILWVRSNLHRNVLKPILNGPQGVGCPWTMTDAASMTAAVECGEVCF